MPTLSNHPYTRSDLRRHVMDLRHLADIRPFELSDGPGRGARCLHVRNAAGLDFTILADRGMGLYDAQFQGVPLAFISSVGATHPAYAEQPGFGWLRTWPGGFLTPCGLGVSSELHLWTASIRNRRPRVAGVDDHRGGDGTKNHNLR